VGNIPNPLSTSIAHAQGAMEGWWNLVRPKNNDPNKDEYEVNMRKSPRISKNGRHVVLLSRVPVPLFSAPQYTKAELYLFATDCAGNFAVSDTHNQDQTKPPNIDPSAIDAMLMGPLASTGPDWVPYKLLNTLLCRSRSKSIPRQP